ncbi:RdgB/HAM1 family non-canonical purine NTP pyrophosphatase [Vulgatibacter incomptus]|uniref:dITP/XTP pyrophosphatase n=1 Tax=Vulgatibacter incomptus TaxID=1391653 RepID=A0A0K1P9Q0_9BACT|nr:RdgB/HAM1 family non-canonical purine NTP pyrophosphatase [Vulgatibacter incomptus]AKU90222.1 Nucleoside 5-triphosphatase RdgB (dHAPTP, dITP, XTP-specific) [Vulgatibacter incomptus]
MKILVASTNEKKLRELRDLVEGMAVEIVSPRDLDRPLPEVVEDADTFEGNACKKALAFAAASGLPAIADDSGLCVDALDGAPGIFSARYSGEAPVPDRDARNNAKLLRALAGLPPARRSAHYFCAVCLALPDGSVRTATGRWDGQIAFSQRGQGGFGYDPLFLLPSLGKTAAELPAAEKQARSHRGRAMRALRPSILELSKEV